METNLKISKRLRYFYVAVMHLDVFLINFILYKNVEIDITGVFFYRLSASTFSAGANIASGTIQKTENLND